MFFRSSQVGSDAGSGAPGRGADGAPSVPWRPCTFGNVCYFGFMSATITRAYRYRCDPSAEQRRAFESWFGSARWVWHRSLEYRTQAYRRRGESVTGVNFSRRLTRLKHGCTSATRMRRSTWPQEGLRLLNEHRPGGTRLLREEGGTSGDVAALAATEPAPAETRTDPAGLSPATRRVRYGTGRAA